MSSKVKRYAIISDDWDYVESPSGGFIDRDDYADLEAECERLRGTMMEVVTKNFAKNLGRAAKDKELDYYLSEGIRRLQAERDALAAELDRLLEGRVLDAETISTLEQELKQSRDAYQNIIDQTTPLEPVPGDPRWSKRIELDEVIAERDQLRAELAAIKSEAEQ